MIKTHSDIYTKISDHVKKHNLLGDICIRLEKEFGLLPCIGVEIEFYLSQIPVLNSAITLKQEKGQYQYEIDLGPYTNMNKLITDIEDTKNFLHKTYSDINFHPKPFPDDYGSAMHFHINFLNKDGSNILDNAQCMDHAASSLCHYLIQTFFIFAPDESHYLRYQGLMAPTHVSYGPNNRTVAIRIPEAHPKRLEHRISSPMTDVYLALYTILKSIYLGLKNPTRIKQYNKIYGNAFDKQYAMEQLPQSVHIAAKCLDQSFFYL